MNMNMTGVYMGEHENTGVQEYTWVNMRIQGWSIHG